MAAPSEWTTEISSLYNPIRVIGTGGFASVWMATKRNVKDDDEDPYVAIKVVGDSQYANREVAILSELSRQEVPHPNIMRLLHDSRPEGKTKSTAKHCVVLSLARGPTLHHILTKHGAFGLVMAQVVSRQLIDAVAYLHGHAVIHRDIQPANIIVSGSQLDNPLWWTDSLDELETEDDKRVVETMRKACKATLVDFGFARALCPEDMDLDIGLRNIAKEGTDTTELPLDTSPRGSIDGALLDTSINQSQRRGRSRTPRRTTRGLENMDSSASHCRVRDLSALGTRNYAAPEIMTGIRKLTDSLNQSFHKCASLTGLDSSRSGKPNNSSSTKTTNTSSNIVTSSSTKQRTLGECVSDYGMVADAFSVGATIRHMVTGVPPNLDVEEFLASKNHPLKKLAKSFKKRVNKKKGVVKREKIYRSQYDLTDDVSNLIHILTHYDSKKRATVRFAIRHPWIAGNDVASTSNSNNGDNKENEEALSPIEHGGPIVYLECGMVKSDPLLSQ